MKNEEFHVPFIKSLYLIAFVTLVSMVTAHFCVKNLLSSHSNSQEYTSGSSYNQAKAGE